MNDQELVELVKANYGAVARSGLSNDDGGVRAVAEAFGYAPEELAAIPADANMGLSCGNPVATANLRPGEVVVDLGSGGGIDVLLASLKVGPTGKAIGIDMTPEMVERAGRNAVQFGRGAKPANVEFHLAHIDELPLPDGSVDCLISNCVINLAPDKPAVFREMFRVLKPGGRVAVSDIALKKPLPPEVGRDLMAYVGCVAGAILLSDYERQLREVGFSSVLVVDTRKDLNAYAQVEGGSGCCSVPASSSAGASCCSALPASTLPLAQPAEDGLHDRLARILARYDVNEFAASVQVYAVKLNPERREKCIHNNMTAAKAPSERRITMATLQVYDPPMCCSTGVCGPQVDPVLPRFAADLAWLSSQGVTVERFNLAHQPHAFTTHPEVISALSGGVGCLPLIIVDGKIVSRGNYPSRETLAAWTGVEAAPSQPVTERRLPSGCC